MRVGSFYFVGKVPSMKDLHGHTKTKIEGLRYPVVLMCQLTLSIAGTSYIKRPSMHYVRVYDVEIATEIRMRMSRLMPNNTIINS